MLPPEQFPDDGDPCTVEEQALCQVHPLEPCTCVEVIPLDWTELLAPPFTAEELELLKTAAGRALLARRRAARMRERRRRQLEARRKRRRPPSHPLNACRTDWPGGYRYVAPGEPLPPGWQRTRFDAQGPTNPNCYPSASLAHLDTGNNGTFWGARRAAILGYSDANQVAKSIDNITAAMAKGTLTEPVAGNLIAQLITPGLAAAQAAEQFKPLTAAELAAKKAAGQTNVDLLGALSLREVADACGKHPGPWACYERWPGGWLAFDDPRVGAGTGPWWGPTPYGTFLPQCFGHKYDPVEKLGRWIIKTTTAAPAAIAQPLTRLWQALVPTPFGTPITPAAPPPADWMCRGAWPGGWMTLPEYLAKGSPAGWFGPTPYGVRVPGCFGGA